MLRRTTAIGRSHRIHETACLRRAACTRRACGVGVVSRFLAVSAFRSPRTGLVAACLRALPIVLVAASHGLVAVPHGRAEPPSETASSRQRWTFLVTTPVTVEGPIVYLRDVLRPLDPELSAWTRLSRSPVGLVPSDGGPMVIRRDRLAQAIRASEATATRIELEGPDKIEVRLVSSANANDSDRSPTNPIDADPPRAVSRRADRMIDGGGVVGGGVVRSGSVEAGTDRVRLAVGGGAVGRSGAKASGAKASGANTLDPATRDRLARRIEIEVRRGARDVGERFDVEVPSDQPGLAALATARRIRAVRFLEPAAAGVCRISVAADTAEGPIESELRVLLDAYPEAVASRATLRRGHVITADDLMLVPVPPDQWHDAYVGVPDSLVGQEVASSVRSGQPIRLGDVRRPILVRRGDLVEVWVNGGGVTVTTNAKSLGEGGKMELIQVETFDPKRTLIARVIDPGRVEVISRTPRTSP